MLRYLHASRAKLHVMTMLTVSADTVGDRLRDARTLARLERRDLAYALGVSIDTIGNWERGKFEPSVSQFIAWAELTNQPADQLIGGLSGSVRPKRLELPTFCMGVEDEFWSVDRSLIWLEFYCQESIDSESAYVGGVA